MDFFKKFYDYCFNNEDFLALALEGSRVYAKDKIDSISDYDLIIIIDDIKKYTNNDEWLKLFGDILIMQKPTDWYNHPYDYKGIKPFTYLVQYNDGNRLDINLYDKCDLDELKSMNEPREVLFNKENYSWFKSISPENYKNIVKPSIKEFNHTVNEFYWLSLYVAKGIKRGEILYVRDIYENYFLPMLYKMISFYIGANNDFSVTVGKSYKYFKDYLDDLEMLELMNLLPRGDFFEIKDKLLNSLEIFAKYAKIVSDELQYDLEDYSKISLYIKNKY